MADRELTGGGGSQLADRLGLDRTHPAGTTALVVLLALGLGWYAGWLLADLGLRWPAFLVVAAGVGHRLYRRPTTRSVLAGGCYGLAVALLITPVAIDLTFLLLSDGTAGVGNRWAFVLTVADLLYLVVFGVLAAIPAAIGWLLLRRG